MLVVRHVFKGGLCYNDKEPRRGKPQVYLTKPVFAPFLLKVVWSGKSLIQAAACHFVLVNTA